VITIKSPYEMDAMRDAGRVVGRVLREIEREIKPGVRTKDLDRFAEELIRGEGALPAFKGYQGFPATVCISVNDEVVHGIPGDRVLKEGDIVGIDVGAKVRGFYGDAARTFCVGRVDALKRRLVEAAQEALARGIEQAVVGNRISDISHAIESAVARYGFSVVRQYVGHGIGAQLHEEPQVPNFGRPHEGPSIRSGMALAIEPMVNAGTHEVVLDGDGWTVRTSDGGPSSHFEHTVLITEKGTEILTEYA
jgi:methionyl aminopeptidase